MLVFDYQAITSLLSPFCLNTIYLTVKIVVSQLKIKTKHMSLVVVGSMAFDAIETPFGKSDKIIGGAATYIAWCASNFTTVKQISVVGGDFPQSELDALANRGVILEGVQIKKDEKTFFWSGKYHLDMNTPHWLERLPESFYATKFKPVFPKKGHTAKRKGKEYTIEHHGKSLILQTEINNTENHLYERLGRLKDLQYLHHDCFLNIK